ncbi:MAG: antibiotic biosynthesis monooxygenase [Nocardioides sp.]
MYARSTTVKAQREHIDEGIAQVRDEVLPSVMEMAGCIGLSMLVDRGSGECIVTTSWASQEAMHATAEMVKPLRERATEILSGAASVQEWEIAVMHRMSPARHASHVRGTWFSADPRRVEEDLATFRIGVLPKFEELPGFCSASLLIDRTSGMAVSSTGFDSLTALEASRAGGEAIRSAAASEMGLKILDIHEYELPLAHLHVPEMA